MSILKDLSTEDRPREKLLKFGAAHLTNSELLALVLNTSGLAEHSVLDLARGLLSTSGKLRALATKSISELEGQPGIGPAKAAVILAVFELAHRYEEEKLPLPKYFHSPAEIAEHFQPRFRDARQEVFTLLCLSARRKLLGETQLAVGTLTSVVTEPREIFNRALSCGAAGIILMHNHPSGEPDPSGHDSDITQRVSAAGELLSVPLIDHIILGDGAYFSFHEAGLL